MKETSIPSITDDPLLIAYNLNMNFPKNWIRSVPTSKWLVLIFNREWYIISLPACYLNVLLHFVTTGEYINGECQCNPGWKGKECSLRHDECEVPDCNGHGHCTNGKCNCVRGYKGKYCEEVDCPHPTCSGHGFCAEGTCICKKGWKGADCSQMDKEALQCLPDCSGHGNFDLETQTCLCEPMWSGDDCSKGKEYQSRVKLFRKN